MCLLWIQAVSGGRRCAGLDELSAFTAEHLMSQCQDEQTGVQNVTESQVPKQTQLQLHVDWSGADQVPVTHVNQIAIVIGPPTKNQIPDGIYLMLGNVVPPIIAGDSSEARQRSILAAQERGLHVDVYGRYHLSRDRLDDLIGSLQAAAKSYDEAVETSSKPQRSKE